MTTTKKFNLIKKIAFAIILALCFIFITQVPAVLNRTYAQTEVQYEQVTLTNGSFNKNTPTYLTSSPDGWSLKGTSTGKNGVINVSNSKFKQESFALTNNPSKGYTEFDDNVLMINANSEKGGNLRNHAGYKSNSISLDAYSYYEISFYVLTQDSAKASAYITGLDDNVENTSYELISTNVWREYKFYISTGIDTETVNLELWLGSQEKTSSDAVFFDEVVVRKTSGSYYYESVIKSQQSLNALQSQSTLTSDETQQKEEYEKELETKNVIDLTDFESNVIENANFENGISSTTPINGWKLANDFSTNVNSSIVRVDKKESMQVLGIEDLGSSLSQNNKYALVLYSNTKTHFGYKSSSFELNPYETYKITVWAKLSSNFSGNAYVKLVEGDDINEFYKTLTDNGLEIDEYTPQTKSITISSNTTNTLTNDYTAYSFYVKGHELYKTSLSLELWFGDEDNNATGSVAFDDITFEKISWEQFSSASSTNSASLTLTTVESTPTVSNGAFNVGLDVEKDAKYPIKPANWTITQEDESAGIYGIVNTYSDYYETNKANYGNLKNPGNPSGLSVDMDVNNVLMMYNNQKTYQKITSDSISVSKQLYKRLSFAYKTVAQSFDTKLMNVYVLDSNDNVIYSDEGLYSSEWKTYSILIKSSEYSDSIKLVISLGDEDNKVTGYLFVDNVTFEEYSEMTDEKFVEYSKSNNNIINFTITNFDLISKDTTLGLYTPYKYTQTLESGENPTNGDPIAYGGIVDGASENKFGITNSTSDASSTYMPAIVVNGQATYTLTNKDSLSLETGKYYKFTIDIYTIFSGDLDQSNVSEEDKVKYGAIFKLSGIDKSLSEIVSNDKWTTYTIYVEVSESTDVSLKFGLESGTNDITGKAFFDNFTYAEVEEIEYTQATNNASDDKTMLVITKNDTTDNTDNENTDDTTDNENDNMIWYLIPSLILFVALVIAIVAYFMKKITIKKWEKKKASEYDRNSTLYRDVIRREAEQIRDKKVKETQNEIDKIKEEIEQLEQAHKEHTKVQRTTTGNISLSQERDFKLYAKKHTALENQIEKLQGKIDNMNMPEYLLSVQRSLILERVKKEKQAKDEALKKQKLEQKKQKMANKQDK